MKVKTDTIIRTVLLVVALINQALLITGHSVLPLDDETLTEVLSLLFTIATALAAWWKNNSFTADAIRADNYLEGLRNKD